MSADTSKEKKPTETETSAIDLPKGDESVTDIPDGVSEDVYRFWKENGTSILLYCGIALVGFLAIQGWKQFSASRENSIRESFASLNTTEERVEFANKHKNHPLAAYAYLKAANEAFEAEEYTKATEYYDLAIGGLDESPLAAVAMMGKASSAKESGDSAAASGILEAIASNEFFAEGIRAEAMFKRVVIALADGQDDVVQDYTTKLEAIDNTQFWAQRLESIKNYQ